MGLLKKIALLIVVLPLLSSCIREEEVTNTPQGNFEALWKIIDEQYCFLEYKQIDWNAIHDKYSKLITNTMSSEGLFEVLGNMLNELKDGHVNLASAHNVSYYDAWYQDYPRNFREDIVEDVYLGKASTDYRTAAGVKYKIFEDNIGYIRYESFSSGIGDGNLDEILSYLAACNGLIIDVRSNGGGNVTNSTRIAARFTNKKVLTGYIRHKTGKGHNDFSEPYPIELDAICKSRRQPQRRAIPLPSLPTHPSCPQSAVNKPRLKQSAVAFIISQPKSKPCSPKLCGTPRNRCWRCLVRAAWCCCWRWSLAQPQR